MGFSLQTYWSSLSSPPLLDHVLFQISSLWHICLGWLCMDWLIASWVMKALSPQQVCDQWKGFSSIQFSSVQLLSCVQLLVTPWTAARQPPCPSPTARVHPNPCPSSRWYNPAISYSVVPLSSCPQSLPASESFPMSQLFAWCGQSIGVSALTSVLTKNTQDWCPLGWLVGFPCSPRDSQESSPTTQFKSINSLALSLLHSPTLKSIHDHWKNHRLD